MLMKKNLADIADEIEQIVEDRLLDSNGLLLSLLTPEQKPFPPGYFSKGKETITIPGYEKLDFSDFLNYENTGMVQGTFLSAMCLKYKCTGNENTLSKARRTFKGICRVYDMSQEIAQGFYCKPWGGRLTNETSSDQYIYTMTGLDDFFELALPEEKKRIRSMIVAMANFWLERRYCWNYYGQSLEWPKMRFISLMALAVKHGGGDKFLNEWKRLDRVQQSTSETPFRSTVPEKEFEQNAVKILSVHPDSCLSTFLSLESAMKQDNKPFYLDICRRSFEYGCLGLTDDGNTFAFLIRDKESGGLKELEQVSYNPGAFTPLSRIIGPYRRGGMQNLMFARFAASYEAYAPECGGLALAEGVLRKVGVKHLTWYEDPFLIMPPEIQWKVNVFSGDAAAHWLWCYWKLAEQNAITEIKGEKMFNPRKSRVLEVMRSRSPEEVKALNNQRRLIETVIAQLTERFNAEKIRARDLWHLTVRISRKLLAHSINCCINQKYGNPLLQFERIFC